MPTVDILKALSTIESLRQKARALAALDVIMSPDWKYRYSLFNANWSDGEMMATVTNGSGDDVFLLFTNAGAILKGFDHESFMSPYAHDENALWLGLFTSVPAEFASFLTEPAFTIENSTFCAWRRYSDDRWKSDVIDYPDGDECADGSKWLLQEYVEGPQAYVDFCRDYYERDVALEVVEGFYKFKPFKKEMLAMLNPEAQCDEVRKELLEIGYPI